MKKMKLLILAGMVLAAGLAEKANATIVTSTSSVLGSVLVSTPTATGQKIRLKACQLGNDTALASCVQLKDLAATNTTKAIICASARAMGSFPNNGTGANVALAGTSGSISTFFGEDLVFTGGFQVVGATESANIQLVCSYTIK